MGAKEPLETQVVICLFTATAPARYCFSRPLVLQLHVPITLVVRLLQ